MWRWESAGRTRVDAALTSAATVPRRFIGRQFERGQNFREEKPRPKFFIDPHRAFAVPTNSSRRGVIAFQNRPGLYRTLLFAAKVAQEIVDLVQLRLDQLVIVIAPCITRDSSCSGPECFRGRLFTLKVMQRYN